MSGKEHELGKALVGEEDRIDFGRITEQVLRRDRRRMWWLGAGCVIAWMAVVMLPWATVMPMLAKVVEHQARQNAGQASNAELQDVLQAVKTGTIATFVFSIGSMLVAAVCTVTLILLSRRATLRQVNARLAEIALEVKALGRLQ